MSAKKIVKRGAKAVYGKSGAKKVVRGTRKTFHEVDSAVFGGSGLRSNIRKARKATRY